MTASEVRASIIIVNTNERSHLETCLPSVCDQTVDDYEVIVVDNDSTDGSVEFVREEFPAVRVVENDGNHWYAGGNNDGFAAADGEYLVALNPDVEVDEEWLEHLLAPFEADEGNRVGLTTSQIVRFDDRVTLNTCGNVAHYTGLGFCRGLDEPVWSYPDEESVPAVSGCSFAMRREVYDEIGDFDETFELYFEDLDLSWRARLAGYDIKYAPESVVYHKYELELPAWKFFNMERNRNLILLKHLRYRSLLFLLPGLLLTELIIWLYALLNGREFVLQKLRAWMWLFRNRRHLECQRRFVQERRRRSDEQLLAEFSVGLPISQFGVSQYVRPVARIVTWLLYWPWYWLHGR